MKTSRHALRSAHSATRSLPALAAAVAWLCVIFAGFSFPQAVQAERLTPAQEAARIEAVRREIAEKGLDFQVGPNSLTDIPWEEFEDRYLGLRLPEGLRPRPIIDDHGVNDRHLPSEWDWREHGGVTGVRHQGACGSCWCFSAAGAFESAIMLDEGFEVDISEQYALSCNTGGSGCSGGWMADAYEVWQTYGAVTEEDMPYEADDTIPCPGSTYPAVAKIDDVHDVGFSVSQIKDAIYNHGPVSATMMVYPDLVPYESGCYYHSCSSELNHAILLVGWDDSYCTGQGAWIMKNSWGDDWGMDGYAYMQYDAACIGGYGTYVDYLPIANLLGINHTPLENTENTTDPYEVLVEIVSTGGSVDLTASYTAYRVDGGGWVYTPFAHIAADDYKALVPAQPAGTRVEYYLHAEDTAGLMKTVPMWAPDDTFVFTVGTFEVIVSEDFETDPGWTIGAPGDNATTGIWELADPEGTYSSSGYLVQAEDDHTPSPGRFCFVTDGRAGSTVGSYDVDDGRTTLLSAVYDLSEYELVVVDYRRWYTNRRGSNPHEDIWEVSVRSGASDWMPIEYSESCRENWSHQVHILNCFIELGPEVQFRFVASDEDGGSIVEALVDDFELRGIPSGGTAVPEEEEIAARPVLRTSPNPFRTETAISFRMPEPCRATIHVYDCAGREVRLLYDGEAGAEWQHLHWDGRDEEGNTVSSGVYFLRAVSDGPAGTEKVVVVR